MQVCTSLQTDNHASTPPLSFLQVGCPTNGVKALKAICRLFSSWTYHFRTLYSSQKAYLHLSLHVCQFTRSLRLFNTNLPSAVFVRTSFGTRSFSVAALRIWNSLPPSLRTCTSPDTFRRRLKIHYCQQAFQST